MLNLTKLWDPHSDMLHKSELVVEDVASQTDNEHWGKASCERKKNCEGLNHWQRSELLKTISYEEKKKT